MLLRQNISSIQWIFEADSVRWQQVLLAWQLHAAVGKQAEELARTVKGGRISESGNARNYLHYTCGRGEGKASTPYAMASSPCWCLGC